MKPLDKLEQKLFEKIRPHVKSSDKYGYELDSMIDYIASEAARECAEAAKDLAERAMLHGMGHSYKKSKLKSFLTSEGITE